MSKYKVKTALSLAPDPKKPSRTRLVRAGTEVELTDEQAADLREKGVLVEDEEDGAGDEVVPAAGEVDRSETELPTRPSNGGTKVEWRAYLEQLKAVTDPEMDESLEIPADATRDQMIEIGDKRVADWNEE